MEIELGAPARGPLSGIRVLDLTTAVSGPLCTQILGDLGAEIIKIESPAGDSARKMGLPIKAGINPLFAQCNRNKRSIVIDLKQESGTQVARQLSRDSDVVVNNYRPGVMDRLGLGYDDLREENPGLLYVDITGFGPDGPYREQPAYDTVIQGLGGFMPTQGGDRSPELIRMIGADKTTSLTAAYSILAALFDRERSGEGRGQRISIPMLDAWAAFVMPDVLGSDTFPDEDPFVMPNIHRTWETADGFVVMMIVEDDQFAGLCRVLEREELIDDPRCTNLLQRIIHAAELFEDLEAELKKWATSDLVERARKLGAPLAPANDVDAFLADPQVHHNRTVIESEHDPELGRMRLIRHPAIFSETPVAIRRLPPRLGEQTSEILRAAGYDEDAIEVLIQSGAVA